MAAGKRRVNYHTDEQTEYGVYENGSAVRAPAEERQVESGKARAHKPQPRVRTGILSRGFVLFLAAVCVAAFSMCISFLQQKAELTNQYETIARLENRYNVLKDDNDARYNEVMRSVSLDDIRKAALTRLGMHYADASQIQYYTVQDDSYVRQYREVPNDQ